MKLFIALFFVMFFILFAQHHISLSMEEPKGSDKVLIKFEGDEKGSYFKNVLAVSETMKDLYFPLLDESENYIALYGTNGGFFKKDFETFIYRLMEAHYKNQITQKNEILSKIEKEPKEDRKRIYKALRYLDLKVEHSEDNRKRIFEDLFDQIEEQNLLEEFKREDSWLPHEKAEKTKAENSLIITLKNTISSKKSCSNDNQTSPLSPAQKNCIFALSYDGNYIASYCADEPRVKIMDVKSGTVRTIAKQKECDKLLFLIQGQLAEIVKNGRMNVIKVWNLSGTWAKKIDERKITYRKPPSEKSGYLMIIPNGVVLEQKKLNLTVVHMSYIPIDLFVGDISEEHYFEKIYYSSNGLVGAGREWKSDYVEVFSFDRCYMKYSIEGRGYLSDLSSDGKLLAFLKGERLDIWDIEKREMRSSFDSSLSLSQVTKVKFSPKNTFLMVYNASDFVIEIWNLATGKCKHILQAESKIARARISLDETLLAMISERPNLELSGTFDSELELYVYPPEVLFNPEKFYQILKIWNMTTGNCVCTKLFNEPVLVDEIKFSTDSKSLIYASDKVYILNIDQLHFNS
jgi:WD40 repeat protein